MLSLLSVSKLVLIGSDASVSALSMFAADEDMLPDRVWSMKTAMAIITVRKKCDVKNFSIVCALETGAKLQSFVHVPNAQ